MYRLLWSRVEIKSKPVKLQAPQLHVLSALGESETDGGAWTLSLSGSVRYEDYIASSSAFSTTRHFF